VPTTWPGARLPHVWLDGHVAVQDRVGPGYTLLRFTDEDVSSLTKAFKDLGAPFAILDLKDAPAREVYGFDLILVRPDLHVVWRGNRMPRSPGNIHLTATGHLPAQRA